jgi:hypothetical protein
MARLDNIGAASATGSRTSAGMRALMVAVIVMAVLIVLGTTVLVVVAARRLGGATATAGAPMALQLGEPDGTRIVGIAAVGDRLAVQLQGGGPDRVVLVDPRNGAVVGHIGLH